ncbi:MULTISPECIES: hypothetical protein [Streptomyces]|uniref:hypothetical protein n=1 Tax=Streptomyces TaxID=1883 RepID=UPI002258F984|nr:MULTISPECIES: hypothetical protein [Streptomyces]MCX4429838.1 hypothetical protein [Streptomyces mirabilis]
MAGAEMHLKSGGIEQACATWDAIVRPPDRNPRAGGQLVLLRRPRPPSTGDSQV